MTFTDRAKSSGAEPVYVVTIEAPKCSLSYGVSPCSAEVGVTGDQKCFNTRATCQDPANYTSSPVGYTFIEPLSELPEITNLPAVSAGIFPFLSGPPRFSASELDPGGGFGIRAACNFSLEDSPHHDIGIDPYVSERAYDPFESGTFFGKWLARNPFYLGSRVWVHLGHIVDGTLNLLDAQSLVYFIETIDGPDSGGSVKVKCKDILKLADNVRAQCPRPSSGQLLDEIQEGETQFFAGPPLSLDEYPSGSEIFKVRIGDEIIRCKRAADTFTVVNSDGSESAFGRGIDKTQQDDHDADSTIQLVKEFEPSTVPVILTELLTDFATVDPDFIDDAQWDEAQQKIGFLFSSQISEPEGVKDLCEQLLKASGAFIYYDERSQLLKLGSIVPTPEISELPSINDDQTFIEDSVRIARRDELRLSQVWYHRGLINSTDDLEDPINYQNRLISADIEAETEEQYGQRRIDKIWGRWTPAINAAAAFTVAGRRLNRFKRTPRMAKFSADTKDAGIWQGDIVAISHRNLQTPTGEQVPTPFQVLRVSHDGHSVVQFSAMEYDVDEVGDFDGLDTIIIDQDATGINLLDIYETTVGPASSAGEIVTVIVLEGVNVREMQGGGFPDSKIRLINRGNVAGLGGAGGAGGTAISDGEIVAVFPGSDGGDGGDAIVMDEDWEIINHGSIYGGSGGGGGGGAGAESINDEASGGGGGGGGQDLILSNGGVGGYPDGEDGEDGDADGAGSGGIAGVTTDTRGGAGGGGGAWATSGQGGGAGQGEESSLGGGGGAPGFAIVQNSFALDLDNSDGEIIGNIDS